MKFLHLGDLHLGKSLGDFDLISDQRYILDQIIHIAMQKQVDAVLLAGDIYDKAIPSEAAVSLFDSFICDMAEKGLKVLAITGNHDSDERLNFGSSLFTPKGIYICAKYEGKVKKLTFEDENGEINIYLMPFIKASQVRHFYPDEEITTYDEAVRVALQKSEVDANARNVLIAHQFVIGKSEEPAFGGSEGLSVQNVGLVEKIGYDCFQDFDYVALGHIHSAQKVGREEVRYSGALLKYSLSEVNSNKSVPVVTIKEKGDVNIELVPLVPKRDMRHIKGKLEQLLDKDHIENQEDFIYATLTDEYPINDAMGIFQQYYPNTVRIDYDNSHTKEIQEIDVLNPTENKTFKEMISDFYLQMYGEEMSEEELQMMKEVAREAGVSDEAD